MRRPADSKVLELGKCIFPRLGIHAVVAFWYLGVTSYASACCHLCYRIKGVRFRARSLDGISFCTCTFRSIFLWQLFVRFRFLRHSLLIFFSLYLLLLVYYLDGIFLFHNSSLIFSPISFQCTVL